MKILAVVLITASTAWAQTNFREIASTNPVIGDAAPQADQQKFKPHPPFGSHEITCLNNLEEIVTKARKLSGQQFDSAMDEWRKKWDETHVRPNPPEWPKLTSDFQNLQQALSSPSLLFCPDDNNNKPVTDWAALAVSHVSYQIMNKELTAQDEDKGKTYIKCPIHGFVCSTDGAITTSDGIELDNYPRGWDDVKSIASKKDHNAVMNDLRQIEAAKHQWALEKTSARFNGKERPEDKGKNWDMETPSENDLKPYFHFSRFPLHPPSGHYVINPVDQPVESTTYGKLP